MTGVNFSCTEINIEEKSDNNRLDVSLGKLCKNFIDDKEEFDFQESLTDNVYLSEDESIPETIVDLETADCAEEIEREPVNKKRKYNGKENLTRKRIRMAETWEKNVRKNAVNCGLEYKHLKTNQVVSARSLKRSCGPGCRFKCDTKITESRRKEIFNVFWSIREQSDKYNFISRYVSEKIDSEGKNKKKLFSRTYTLSNHEGVDVVVCKTMFLNTLSISHKMIETTLLKARGDEGVLKDMRGSKTKSKMISEDKTASVIEHINMFQRVDSHYTRKDSQREYLEETLSLSRMYRLYLEWAKENNKPTSTKHHYTDIFNTKFNISFFKPKKDQCDHCEKFKNAAENEKSSLEIKYNIHIENKEKSRLEKANDTLFAKENEERTSLICFDFQKVLSTPKTESGSLYYKRKLSVYNFTIYDIIRHKAHCYVWSEDDAKKGSNEVASCLLYFFNRMVSVGVDTFLLYSDNCSGQNRNKNLFSMYTYASSKYNIDIKHTFLEVGHTQNEGDSVHAQIERYTAGRKIYSMDDWCDSIRAAKVNDPKYEVINVTYDMIYDFKALAANQNWNKIEVKNGKKSNVPIGISKFKIIKTLKNQPNQLQFKTSFDGNYITLATRKEREHVNVAKYDLRKAYDTLQGLPNAKLKDLLTLCKNNIIPPAYHEYYNKFSVKLNRENETENSDEGEN